MRGERGAKSSEMRIYQRLEENFNKIALTSINPSIFYFHLKRIYFFGRFGYDLLQVRFSIYAYLAFGSSIFLNDYAT